MASARHFAVRLVPLALIIGGALWFSDHHGQRASATLIFEAGAVAQRVRSFDVELRRPAEPEVLGTFSAPAVAVEPGSVVGRWPLTVAAGSYDLTITCATPDGRPTVRRTVVVSDGAVVHVDLAPELAERQPSDPAQPLSR